MSYVELGWLLLAFLTRIKSLYIIVVVVTVAGRLHAHW